MDIFHCRKLPGTGDALFRWSKARRRRGSAGRRNAHAVERRKSVQRRGAGGGREGGQAARAPAVCSLPSSCALARSRVAARSLFPSLPSTQSRCFGAEHARSLCPSRAASPDAIAVTQTSDHAPLLAVAPPTGGVQLYTHEARPFAAAAPFFRAVLLRLLAAPAAAASSRRCSPLSCVKTRRRRRRSLAPLPRSQCCRRRRREPQGRPLGAAQDMAVKSSRGNVPACQMAWSPTAPMVAIAWREKDDGAGSIRPPARRCSAISLPASCPVSPACRHNLKLRAAAACEKKLHAAGAHALPPPPPSTKTYPQPTCRAACRCGTPRRGAPRRITRPTAATSRC